jgi:predicted TIM-barrel fold metal-dependent hydrolase
MPIIDCYAQLGPQPYPTNATTRKSLETLMKRFGVDMTFVAATEALRGSMVDGNAWLAEQIKGQERFRGYCVVNPLAPDTAQEEMRKYLVRPGFVGAILHEGYVRRPLNSGPMVTLTKALLRFGKPLLLRISDPREISDLGDLAKQFPTQQFVILHMGDRHWPMALTLAAKIVNVFLEVGGMVADYDKLAEALQVVGVHRLLFGTGMPLVSPAYALGMVRDSAIGAGEKDRILARNARQLFLTE